MSGSPTVGVLLGLFCALAYGSGDYLGGRASRRTPAASVVLVVQITGALGMLVVIAIDHTDIASPADLVRGAASGVAGAAGLALLYRQLSLHRASVVAPVTAICGALVPVAWGVLRGERPPAVAIVGVVVALVAIVTVSGAGRGPVDGAGLAAVAGLVLGTTLVLFAATKKSSGLWPVASARVSAAVVVVLTLLVAREVQLPQAHSRPAAIGAGVLDTAGNVFLQIAVRHGLLTVVSPIVALAPAATVLFARIADHEHIGIERAIGLALTIVAVALLALA